MPVYEFSLTGRLKEGALETADLNDVRGDLARFLEAAARQWEEAGDGQDFALSVTLSGRIEGDEVEAPARVFALQGVLGEISSEPVERVFRKIREPRKPRAAKGEKGGPA